MKIEEMIQEFEQYAKESNVYLTTILSVIAEGKAPSQVDVSHLDMSIANLRARYDSIYQAAAAQLPPEEMPAENSPVTVYADALINSKALQIKHQLDQIKSCLHRFLSIRSLVTAYTEALRPIQLDALSLLKSLEENSNIDSDAVITAAAGPQVLLAAIEHLDKDSEEGMALCDQVAEYYPGRIYGGVVGNKYFIDVNAVDTIEESASEHLTNDIELNINECAATDNSELETPTAICSDEPSVTDIPVSSLSSTVNYSQFIEQLHSAHCFIESEQEIGTWTSQKHPNENKKITASIFNNEMRNGDLNAERAIVREISHRDVVSIETLTKAWQMPNEIAQSCLMYMMNKGYLYRYSITPGGEFYCASKRLQKALGFNDACKLMKVKQQKPADWGESIEDASTSVASRVAMASMHASAVQRIISDGATGHFDSFFSMTNAFCLGIENADKQNQCEVLTGAFWKCDEECIEFFDNLMALFSKYANITGFVLGAWDQVRAKNIVDGLLQILGNSMPTCPIRLYILSENAYYNYPDLTPIDEADWKTQLCDSDPKDHSANISISDAQQESNSESIEKPVELPTQDDSDTQTESVEQDITSIQEESLPLPTKSTESLVNEENLNIDAHPAENTNDTDPLTEEQDIIQKMLNSSSTPSDNEFFELIIQILNDQAGTKYTEVSDIAQALLLAKTSSYSKENKKCTVLFRQLSYATRSPLDEVIYTSENLSSAFESPISSTMLLAAHLFALLIPGMPYDYGLKAQKNEYMQNFDSYFPELTDIKPLYAKLTTIADIVPIGFSGSLLARLGSDSESKEYVKAIQIDAQNLLTYSTPKARMKALPLLYNACFGKDSDLYKCLEYVMKNATEGRDYVLILLEEFCDSDEKSGEYTISSQKVDDFLNKKWYEVNGQGSAFDLEYTPRQQALKNFYSRLNVIKRWADHVISSGRYDFARLQTLKCEITDLATRALASITEKQIDCKCVLIWTLQSIIRYLNSSVLAKSNLFNELVQTGVISLNDSWLPILSEELNEVKYCEPWRTVLRHIASPIRSLEDAKNEILDGDLSSDLFDNLRQLKMIGELLDENLDSSTAQVEIAKRSAADASKDFDDKLELDFTYNRITETDKENLAAIKRQHEPALIDRMDYGIWRQFLNGLKRRIVELTNKRKIDLQGMLNARLSTELGHKAPILIAAQSLLDKDLNFAVTEEYINRFDNGEMDFSADLQAVLQETDYFSDFISDKVFVPIYDECFRNKNRVFHSIAQEYLSRHFPREWTSRQKEDSLRFVRGGERYTEKYWPTVKGTTSGRQIKELFNWLGLSVNSAEKIGKSEEIYKIDVIPSPRGKADYRHPISAFGTQAKRQMNVIILHGNILAKELVHKIAELELGNLSIVIINYPISLPVRRQIAEELHIRSGQNSFILIDQVLAIYLALHQITERLPILLNCTLPFTTYQPFVRDGGSTADEMFFGRTRELSDILNPNGACVVYGGRQLGKTALLERAENLFHKPDKKEYAVYCNILNCATENSLAPKIVDDIRKKAALRLKDCNTIEELCTEIEQLFRSNKIERLLLLLDETDKFLGSIADQDYAPIQPLVDLKRSSKNAFKFVLAGLHNVCRAKNATERNGVFGQLGTPLCVKPLSPTDALQLLSRPLRYLGFQIDRYPHLETILTNTNYYPGILQFFGYMLVETLSTHYGKYYRAVDNNPPYTLQDEQLGAVMNSADLNRSIKDKFRWSLELDPRYFMIARCIALRYYLSDESTNTWLGFSIEQIKEVANSYEIHCLSEASENDYLNLLDEMVEMGILSKPDTNKNLYRLRRSSFISIIGSDLDSIDADITKNNTEG